jgi:hypothetical protein
MRAVGSWLATRADACSRSPPPRSFAPEPALPMESGSEVARSRRPNLDAGNRYEEGQIFAFRVIVRLSLAATTFRT